MIKGFSLIFHRGEDTFKHCGSYVGGLFSDRNQEYSPDSKVGWGFKLDLFMVRIVRPMYHMLKLADKKTLETPIHTVPENRWWTEFGAQVAEQLVKKKRGLDVPNEEVHDFKFGVWNPWKGKYWFILDSKHRMPCFFLSVSTPWKSFYVGIKTYDVTAELPPIPEGFTAEQMVKLADQGDCTWAAGRCSDGRYGCPSGSIRSKR